MDAQSVETIVSLSACLVNITTVLSNSARSQLSWASRPLTLINYSFRFSCATMYVIGCVLTKTFFRNLSSKMPRNGCLASTSSSFYGFFLAEFQQFMRYRGSHSRVIVANTRGKRERISQYPLHPGIPLLQSVPSLFRSTKARSLLFPFISKFLPPSLYNPKQPTHSQKRKKKFKNKRGPGWDQNPLSYHGGPRAARHSGFQGPLPLGVL